LLQAIFDADHCVPKDRPAALKKINALLEQAMGANPGINTTKHELLRAIRAKYWEVLSRQDGRQARVGRTAP
jgi:hypothetical protein